MEQGRGGVYIRNYVDSGITYEPRHSPQVRLPACCVVAARTRWQLLLFFSCCLWLGGNLRERAQLPPDTARAPSEAEGAGQEAGTFQVSAKADETQLSGQDLPCSSGKGALFFWTVHGPFSFRQDEKKMGGGARFPMAIGAEFVPRAPGARNLPWQALPKSPRRGMASTSHRASIFLRYCPV